MAELGFQKDHSGVTKMWCCRSCRPRPPTAIWRSAKQAKERNDRAREFIVGGLKKPNHRSQDGVCLRKEAINERMGVNKER